MAKTGLQKIGMLVCVLLLGTAIVAAQTDTTTLEFERFEPLFFGLTEVGIAEDWDYALEEESERVILTHEADALRIELYDSLEQDDFFSIDLEMPTDEALVSFYSDLYTLEIDIADIDVTEEEGETFQTATFEFSPDNVTYLVKHIAHETVFAADTYNLTGDPLTNEQLAIIEQVIMSVRPASTADNEAAATCVITVNADNTVQLRVGPGENRAVIAFIDAGEYTPQGQIMLDGSQWFKLNKAEVAPDSSANEIWLAADDVSTEGDCDAVEDTAAPAIIPAAIAPPAPAESGNSSGEASGNQAPSSSPASGAVTVQSGTYTLSYTTVSRSCESAQYTFQPMTPMQLGLTSASVFVSPSGNALNVDGDVFTLREDGQYFGTYDIPESNANGQVYLLATSPTALQGRMVVNFRLDDGTNCSATVGMIIAR